jgi:hypothetical protein
MTVAQRNRPFASYPWKDASRSGGQRVFLESTLLLKILVTRVKWIQQGSCQQRDNRLLRNRYFGLLQEAG